MEEALGYLEEIGPESNWYVWGQSLGQGRLSAGSTAEMLREKLAEAASLSDDPIIQLGY